MEKKKSLGRQKIEIKKIEKKTSLQVTFSKRRVGLFKKVADLTTLYGVSAAVLVESPGGKLFSFGNPSVEDVFNRCLGLHKDDQPGSSGIQEVSTEVNAVCTNMYAEAIKTSEAEKELEELELSGLSWFGNSGDDSWFQELEELLNTDDGVWSSENKVTTKVNDVCANNNEEPVKEFQAAKKLTKKKDMKELKGDDMFWWRTKPIDNMGLQELEEFRDAVQNFRNNIMGRVMD